jgi:hypothetical protein
MTLVNGVFRVDIWSTTPWQDVLVELKRIDAAQRAADGDYTPICIFMHCPKEPTSLLHHVRLGIAEDTAGAHHAAASEAQRELNAALAKLHTEMSHEYQSAPKQLAYAQRAVASLASVGVVRTGLLDALAALHEVVLLLVRLRLKRVPMYCFVDSATLIIDNDAAACSGPQLAVLLAVPARILLTPPEEAGKPAPPLSRVLEQSRVRFVAVNTVLSGLPPVGGVAFHLLQAWYAPADGALASEDEAAPLHRGGGTAGNASTIVDAGEQRRAGRRNIGAGVSLRPISQGSHDAVAVAAFLLRGEPLDARDALAVGVLTGAVPRNAWLSLVSHGIPPASFPSDRSIVSVGPASTTAGARSVKAVAKDATARLLHLPTQAPPRSVQMSARHPKWFSSWLVPAYFPWRRLHRDFVQHAPKPLQRARRETLQCVEAALRAVGGAFTGPARESLHAALAAARKSSEGGSTMPSQTTGEVQKQAMAARRTAQDESRIVRKWYVQHVLSRALAAELRALESCLLLAPAAGSVLEVFADTSDDVLPAVTSLVHTLPATSADYKRALARVASGKTDHVLPQFLSREPHAIQVARALRSQSTLWYQMWAKRAVARGAPLRVAPIVTREDREFARHACRVAGRRTLTDLIAGMPLLRDLLVHSELLHASRATEGRDTAGPLSPLSANESELAELLWARLAAHCGAGAAAITVIEAPSFTLVDGAEQLRAHGPPFRCCTSRGRAHPGALHACDGSVAPLDRVVLTFVPVPSGIERSNWAWPRTPDKWLLQPEICIYQGSAAAMGVATALAQALIGFPRCIRAVINASAPGDVPTFPRSLSSKALAAMWRQLIQMMEEGAHVLAVHDALNAAGFVPTPFVQLDMAAAAQARLAHILEIPPLESRMQSVEPPVLPPFLAAANSFVLLRRFLERDAMAHSDLAARQRCLMSLPLIVTLEMLSVRSAASALRASFEAKHKAAQQGDFNADVDDEARRLDQAFPQNFLGRPAWQPLLARFRQEDVAPASSASTGNADNVRAGNAANGSDSGSAGSADVQPERLSDMEHVDQLPLNRAILECVETPSVFTYLSEFITGKLIAELRHDTPRFPRPRIQRRFIEPNEIIDRVVATLLAVSSDSDGRSVVAASVHFATFACSDPVGYVVSQCASPIRLRPLKDGTFVDMTLAGRLSRLATLHGAPPHPEEVQIVASTTRRLLGIVGNATTCVATTCSKL